jgi:hypothetical protein
MLDVYNTEEAKIRALEKLLEESPIPEIKTMADNLIAIRHEFKMVFESIQAEPWETENLEGA